jgi:subtilisin family serine protease
VSIYNTHKNGGYLAISGTSQAAPHVAGLAALIWARNPTFTATQVRQAIESSAVDLGSPGKDIQFGWGRIDVTAALGLSSAALVAAPDEAAPMPDAPAAPEQRDREFVPGRVLIKFKPAVDAAGIDRTLSAFAGVSVEGQIGELDIQKLRVPVGQEWMLIDQLRALPEVEFAEPDYIIRLEPAP